MQKVKVASVLAVAFAALSLFPANVLAKGESEKTTVVESKDVVDGKEVKSVKIEVGTNGVDLKDVDYDTVKIKTDGVGDTLITGKARRVKVKVSGASEVDLRDLKAEEVELDVSGYATVHINASKGYEIDASGAGKIYLHSDAPITSDSRSGIVRVFRAVKK